MGTHTFTAGFRWLVLGLRIRVAITPAGTNRYPGVYVIDADGITHAWHSSVAIAGAITYDCWFWANLGLPSYLITNQLHSTIGYPIPLFPGAVLQTNFLQYQGTDDIDTWEIHGYRRALA